MPVFFSHARGIATRVDLGGPQDAGTFQFAMEGVEIGGKMLTPTIITQIAVIEQGNLKHTHTFDGSLFTYIMGDRVGELRVGGMAYSRDCQDPDASGIMTILNAYSRNKVATRRTAIPISLADAAYWGMLTGMNLDISDPEHQMSQWALRLSSLNGF